MADAILWLILRNSLKASILILMVLALRPWVKKISNSVACFLWVAVGIRLACPVSFDWGFSFLQNASWYLTLRGFFRNKLIHMIYGREYGENELYSLGSRTENFGIILRGGTDSAMKMQGSDSVEGLGNSLGDGPGSGIGDGLGSGVGTGFGTGLGSNSGADLGTAHFHSMNTVSWLLLLWMTGVVILVTITLVRYFRIKGQLKVSAKVDQGIYLCDHIDSPFVLGILKPRIYLPSNLERELYPSVLLHEQAHVDRHDNLWKFAAMLLTALHWFNPLVWVSYFLLGRDIELACDERVIKSMKGPEKKGYADALLYCSLKGTYASGNQLAFARVGVKERVVAMTKYKKPKLFAIVLSMILCIGLVGCTLSESGGSGKNETDSHQTEAEHLDAYKTPVKIQVEEGEFSIYKASKHEKILFADDRNIVFLTNNCIYRYRMDDDILLGYRIDSSMSLSYFDGGKIKGEGSCEISLAKDGSAVYLHPYEAEFMYKFDFTQYVSKLPYDMSEVDVLSGEAGTSFTTDRGITYTLADTGKQLKDLGFTSEGENSVSDHFFRGAVEVDRDIKYQPFNKTRYGKSGLFTEKEMEQTVALIKGKKYDWKRMSDYSYSGDDQNQQQMLDLLNGYAKIAGLEADFNQVMIIKADIYSDHEIPDPMAKEEASGLYPYPAGAYTAWWEFGKNPSGHIVLLNIELQANQDEEDMTENPILTKDDTSVNFVIDYGADITFSDMMDPVVLSEDNSKVTYLSWDGQNGSSNYYSMVVRKDCNKFYVIPSLVFRNKGGDQEKSVQILNGKVEENSYIKVKGFKLQKENDGNLELEITLATDTPTWPSYIWIELDGSRRTSNGNGGGLTVGLHDGQVYASYEYFYIISLQDADEAKVQDLLQKGQLKFTQCRELSDNSRYSLRSDDTRLELVKYQDIVWQDRDQLESGVLVGGME